jgi:CubicO group peptidase (beta-lactamase class C family)
MCPTESTPASIWGAVAQLVEQGRLSLDDPLSRHLQGWLPQEVADRIRIRHLLNHTSGLGSYFNERFMNSSRLLFREVKDYQPLVEGETPAFEPGTRWQYSNTGFLLLGAVIESVTGASYFDYIREHVYKPAGMEASDSYEMDIPVPNLALGYFRDEQGVVRENTLMHVVKGGPAGGGYSTVEDLHRFALALQQGKLLSRRMTEVITTAKPEENSPEYGYGFQVDGDPETFGHGGGFPGIAARLSIYRKDGYILAVLSNYGAGAQEIASHVRALIHARR